MKQAEMNNYKFNYVEKGRGENLVLVHGSASDYRTWENQLQTLGKYYRTITYSRRYHWPNQQIVSGEDYAMAQHVEDLERFIEVHEEKPVHLIGHSYGALLCLLLAIKNPGEIRSLILAEPPAITLYVSSSPKPKEIINLLFKKPRIALAIMKFGGKGIVPATKALKQNDLDKALDVFGKATLGNKPYMNLSKERKEQAKINLIKEELLGSGFLPLDKNKIRKIKIPTLLIAGEKSPKLFQYLLQEINKLIPNSEFKIIPKASHIVHEDSPTHFNSTVLSFLKKQNTAKK